MGHGAWGIGGFQKISYPISEREYCDFPLLPAPLLTTAIVYFFSWKSLVSGFSNAHIRVDF
ncbi:hypothetical protein CV014_04630 [Nostoc sp. CMAA1605]|nr:hypothetical protein [Nostoc sp. CMAA1605]